jgi:hypothetical protein
MITGNLDTVGPASGIMPVGRAEGLDAAKTHASRARRDYVLRVTVDVGVLAGLHDDRRRDRRRVGASGWVPVVTLSQLQVAGVLGEGDRSARRWRARTLAQEV